MGYWNPYLVYACAFYVVIAFHFRTSTLNLPIDAGLCGFGPFIMSYVLMFIMEVITIILGFQAFHNTRQRIIEKNKEPKNGFDEKIESGNISSEPLINKGEDNNEMIEDTVISNNGLYDDSLMKNVEDQQVFAEVSDDDSIIINENSLQDRETKKQDDTYVDLSIPEITRDHYHSYFSYFADFFFILALFPLASSIGVIESFLLIFTEDNDTIEAVAFWIIPFFFIITTLIILIFTDWLAIVLSATTNINVLAILIIVLLGSIVAINLSVNDKSPSSTDHWNRFLDPIFTGKLTLCRNCFYLPFLFSRSLPGKGNTRIFIFCMILGLITSCILTIFWIIVVLNTVPQRSGEQDAPSLSSARENGELSPVPFSQVVSDTFPSLSSMATIMALFITFSLVITYLVNVIALRHIFYGFFERVMATNYGDWIRRQCVYPKFVFGAIFFWVFVIFMTIVCQILFSEVGLILEMYDSLFSVLADFMVMGIIISDLFYKPRENRCDIINRKVSRILTIVLCFYYVLFFVTNLVHGMVRVVSS